MVWVFEHAMYELMMKDGATAYCQIEKSHAKLGFCCKKMVIYTKSHLRYPGLGQNGAKHELNRGQTPMESLKIYRNTPPPPKKNKPYGENPKRT